MVQTDEAALLGAGSRGGRFAPSRHGWKQGGGFWCCFSFPVLACQPLSCCWPRRSRSLAGTEVAQALSGAAIAPAGPGHPLPSRSPAFLGLGEAFVCNLNVALFMATSCSSRNLCSPQPSSPGLSQEKKLI